MFELTRLSASPYSCQTSGRMTLASLSKESVIGAIAWPVAALAV